MGTTAATSHTPIVVKDMRLVQKAVTQGGPESAHAFAIFLFPPRPTSSTSFACSIDTRHIFIVSTMCRLLGWPRLCLEGPYGAPGSICAPIPRLASPPPPPTALSGCHRLHSLHASSSPAWRLQRPDGRHLCGLPNAIQMTFQNIPAKGNPL